MPGRFRSLLKRLSPAWLLNLYRWIRPHAPSPMNLDYSIRQLLEKSVGRETEIIVLDVGANVGQSVIRFNRYLEQAVFHTFEPIPSCHALLLDRFQGPNFFHNRVALSNTNGTKDFYEFRNSHNSSFLPLDITSTWASKRAETYTEGNIGNLVAERYEVPTMTLDSYLDKSKELANNRIHLLKMDTQGNESKVLEGATKLLSDPLRRPLLIESEIILGAMYEKHLNFFDIEQYLIPRGYRLTALLPGANLIDYPDWVVNALYASPELESEISR